MSPTDNPVGFYALFIVVAVMVAVLFWCCWMVFVEKPDWLFDSDPNDPRNKKK